MSKIELNDRYHYLSVDEKSVSRWYDYFGILADESTGVVLDVVEGRNQESVDSLQ
ncbi:hypothetical protein [Flavobacterium sp. RS13.1]|uniref:hypothetical protein n=1 Tax=Flavobacterium sp. RS13.1 TaxID=3400345 RepID=UPI003AB04A6E